MGVRARNEIWIISDNNNADKMMKFHELKNSSNTDLSLASWYIFEAFDTHIQTANSIGNAYQQLERCLNKTLEERDRVPHSIIFLLGDQFLNDKKLMYNTDNLRQVLMSLCKQLKWLIQTYISYLPNKVKPLQPIQLFITKPLPKPEGLFRLRKELFRKHAADRHKYNEQLVSVLHEFDFKFINAGITSEDTKAFNKCLLGKSEKIILSPHGLYQFWQSIRHSLLRLHKGAIGSSARTPASQVTAVKTSALPTRAWEHKPNRSRKTNFTQRGPPDWNRRTTLQPDYALTTTEGNWKDSGYIPHEPIDAYFTKQFIPQ